MGQTNNKPGSAKGVPKPVERCVDARFPDRLRKAMGDLNGAQLARRIGATKQVIGQYLSGQKKNPAALLIFLIADELKVSPRWLLTGVEERAAIRAPAAPAKQERRERVTA